MKWIELALFLYAHINFYEIKLLQFQTIKDLFV
jgi:hypothetical protein